MQFEICQICGNYRSHCTCKTHVHYSEPEISFYDSLLEKSTVELLRMKERIDQIILNRQVLEGE